MLAVLFQSTDQGKGFITRAFAVAERPQAPGVGVVPLQVIQQKPVDNRIV